MDCSLSGSSVHGIFQARVPEWVAISFSRQLGKTVVKKDPRPRDETSTQVDTQLRVSSVVSSWEMGISVDSSSAGQGKDVPVSQASVP